MSCILNSLRFCSKSHRVFHFLRSNVTQTLSPLNEQLVNREIISSQQFHTSLPRCSVKPRDRKDLVRGKIVRDEGTDGERTELLNAVISKREDMFTDVNTPNLLFNGVKFSELPICCIKSTKNNTLVVLADHTGKCIMNRTAGMEGFKNTRKGTNVAGQAAAMTLSQRAVRIGIIDVRVKVDGIGPGRLAAIKGLEMGGLNIISITDDTRVSFKPTLRPRKRRRL